MKRNAITHPKVVRLALLLGKPRYAVVGVLESLWHFTMGYAPAGNVGRWKDGEICQFIGWEGDPAHLVNTLVDAGWLDRDPIHRLLVHDWSGHCDDSVNMALGRAESLFADGKRPKLTRLPSKDRPGIEMRLAELEKARKLSRGINGTAQEPHTERTLCAQEPHYPSLPSPPLPSPPSSSCPEKTPNEGSEKPKARKYTFDDRQMRFAKQMLARITALDPDHPPKPPNLDAWANEIRLIEKRDGRDLNDAWALFVAVNGDPFWQVRILSPESFRKHFDKLHLQVRTAPVKTSKHQDLTPLTKTQETVA